MSGNKHSSAKRSWHSAARIFACSAPLWVLASASSVFLAATVDAHGQASSSSDAAGTITDVTGAGIPGAVVHLVNNSTKAERTASTNDSGQWSIANLPPANYSLRVEKQGFKSASVASLDVLVGQAANGSITLQVGGSTETIEVSTLPPQLQTQEATVGQVIDQKQIMDLPLNGRNVLQLATLAPGVTPAQTGNTGTAGQYGTRALFITVDGGRASSTNYVLDGTYIRSIRFNNMAMQPNTDTIQEFNMLRSTFSTEYGQGQAVVSMVTKSGSNAVHGTAYEFARNSIFDARNYFNPKFLTAGQPSSGINPQLSFSRHQYGGTVGFPIVKDKIFVFGGYEGLRTTQGKPVYGIYPTQAQISAAARTYGNTSGVPTYQVAKVLQPFFPQTGNTTIGGNNFVNNANFTDTYDQYVVRSDQTLTAKQTLYERYINYDAAQFAPATQGGTSFPLVSRNAVIGHTFLITPKIVNEFRLGYNYVYAYQVGIGVQPGTNFSSLEGLSNVTALTDATEFGRSSVAISGFSTISDGGADQGSSENVYSLGDTVSNVRGKHTVKLGFQFQWRQINQKADNNGRGSFTFNATGSAAACVNGAGQSLLDSFGNCTNPALYQSGLQNYIRGFCTACNAGFGTTTGHYRDNTYGAFINDVWQIGHGLTLNAGLRWEYNSPFVEQNGLEGAFVPSAGKIGFHKVPDLSTAPAVLLANVITTPYFGAGIVQPYKKGFGPRLGLAYEVHPGTVFRVGYGIYFDNINANELQFTRYAAPLYYQTTLNNQNVQGLFPSISTLTSVPAPFSVDPGNKLPYTQEYTASLQQDLGHGMIIELAFTGDTTHRLWKRYDQNQDIIGLNPVVQPGGQTAFVDTGVRPYPNFLHGMLTSSTRASANFTGGSIKVEKRAKNGLYMLGSYQWSKNLDNNSGEVEANDTALSNNFNQDHSYSRFDVRNRAVISGGYELPFGKGKPFLTSGVANAIAGGWSVQPAVRLQTGFPLSISANGGNFCTYCPQRASLAPGRKSGHLANPSPFHWLDITAFASPGSTVLNVGGVPTTFNNQGTLTRNTERGPGTPAVDVSLLKNFHIYERVTAQFRGEAFNVINRAIFGNPGTNISTPGTFGIISSTSGTPADNRSLQLALKILF
jgi:hypothetical protein